MRPYKPNNRPLPNLPVTTKLLATAALSVGIGLFLLGWGAVLMAVYRSESMEDVASALGIELGVLADTDASSYIRLFILHAMGMAVLLSVSYLLFRKTSIRRRVRSLLIGLTVVFVVLDLWGWYRAPSCSSTNNIVGILGILSAIPLLIIALTPLAQMWIYKRWRSPTGTLKRVVIVGGGFAGLYAALGVHRKLGYNRDLEIVLLDRRNYSLFPPLLPSAAAGTIETRQVSYPFRRIFETTNVIFRRVEVTRIDPSTAVVHGRIETNRDPETGEVSVRDAQFPYDYLVLAPGSVTQTFGTKGVAEHAFFMRELNDAVVLRNQVIDLFERAAVLDSADEQRELLRFIIVGAGPTGIETATELYDLIHHVLLKRYPEIDRTVPEVVVIQSGKQVLPGWPDDIVQLATRQLAKMRIKILFGSRVVAVGPRSVSIANEPPLPSRTVIWCAGVKPSPILAHSGLPLHESGRVGISDDLSVPSFPNVFVLGDAAYLLHQGKPLPPLGQVAFQQGSHAAKNIVRALTGDSTKPFTYFDFGGLVSVGEHFAAVNLLGLRISGFLGWLIWRALYLGKLPGVSNKIRVLIDWFLDLMIERSISQIKETDTPMFDSEDIALPQRD